MSVVRIHQRVLTTLHCGLTAGHLTLNQAGLGSNPSGATIPDCRVLYSYATLTLSRSYDPATDYERTAGECAV